MNNNRLHKAIEEIKAINLTSAEKQLIFRRIVGETEEASVVSYATGGFSVSRWIRNFSTLALGHRFSYAVLPLLVVLLSGGGIVFAAEGALPGDLLYPVKIHFGEPLRGAVAFGAPAQARWETKKAERRLEEAENLATEDRLNVRVSEELGRQLEKHTDAFSVFVREIDKDGPSEKSVNVRLDFEAKINAHARILDQVGYHSSNSSQDDSIKKLSDVVETKARLAGETRADVTVDFLDQNRPEGTKNATSMSGRALFRDEEQSVKSLIERVGDRLETDDQKVVPPIQKDILDDSRAALESAEESLKAAEKEHDAGDAEAAYSDLLDSRRAVQEADISIKRGAKLGERKLKLEARLKTNIGQDR